VRDLLNVLSAFIGVGIYVAFTTLRRGSVGSDLSSFVDLVPEPVWWLLPSTWAANSMVSHTESVASPVISFLALLGLLVIGVLLGGRASLVAFFAETQSVTPRGVRSGSRERSVGLSWLPIGSRGRAIVSRELSHVWRDPMVKSLFIRQLGFILLPVILPLVARQSLPPGGALVHFAGVLLMIGEGELLLNIFAVEGKGLRQTLSHPIPPAELIRGKNIAYAIFFLPFNIVAMIAADAVCGFPVSPAVVVVEAIAILVVASGLGNVASLYFPIPMPQASQRAIQNQAQEGRGRRLFGRFLFALLLAIAVLPVVLPAAFLSTLPISIQVATLAAILFYAGICYGVTLIIVDRQLPARFERLMWALE